ncbi:MAG: GNAT family N-acyltransferase [Pseudomonadota bacterium]
MTDIMPAGVPAPDAPAPIPGVPLPTRAVETALGPQDLVLGRLGNLTTRLARNRSEVVKAQELRYRVFFEERGHAAKPSAIDADAFDPHCDHLLVLDGAQIVGTYRLLPKHRAAAAGGFYSAQEFCLDGLTQQSTCAGLLELGRSCILPSYREKRTMELLWGGTWAYALAMGATRLFGCASFEGTDPLKHERALSLLAASALLEGHEDCPAAAHVPQKNRLDLKSLSNSAQVSPREVLRLLPPLLKGYLRVGARFASTAVIDQDFGTTDVLVVLDVDRINPRYINHYGADASRYRS